MTEADLALLRERRCYICLAVIPEGVNARVWSRFLTCPACTPTARAAEFDHGRRLPVHVFMRLLRAMRPEAAR